MTPSNSAAGGSHSADALRQALLVPFALTRTTAERDVRRLRCGGIDGARTWRFDLSAGSRGYSAAVAELRGPIGVRISITRRGMLTRPVAIDGPELEIGTDALRRRFAVRSNAPQIAADILDDELCSWLLSRGRAFHYEIARDRVLAYGRRRHLGGRAALCAALGLATYVRDRQLAALGIETHTRVRQLAALSLQASSSTSTPSPVKQTRPAIFMASARGSS